tara:strand:+ start:10 stop:216 length:207 start_codon:yes stop_codon:yes gene_type:complete
LFFKTDKVFHDRSVAVLFCHHKNAPNLSLLSIDLIKSILFLVMNELTASELKALDEIKKHSKGSGSKE